ncbi:MAG: acetyl-CoA carboxylase biotin carboxylase subunit [candidate division Zixibacteria bacterium]|nr:acetyl-CoA carboxylase biotin carboxylase subunit [candidate division Zixibacteria bacterium]
MFEKILIANRGEIAVRVIRTCREMGIQTVAVFSEADRGAPHVRYADEACLIGPALSRESYLLPENIIAAARKTGAQAVHPGYGFLSERAAFADRCVDAGIAFIGPSGEAMRAMGDKTAARRAMRTAGVPVVPGTEEGLNDDAEAVRVADEVGYPVLIKAAMGGGGKGMRIVRNPEELASALRSARSEALSAFGDGAVYIEKYLEDPRHVEFQILADAHGHTVHLGERECSVQRRHQKLIEESPSCILDDRLRAEMGTAAVRAAEAAGYVNAGTIEFIVDRNRNFYFLEMNTRLQVEHPVTEMRTGLDLVREQILVASGSPLRFTQEEIPFRGAAIECRISAEDPDENFMPSIGKITRLVEPGGPGVRIDSGFYRGYEVPIFYDPMIAKLIVWAETRDEAIARMKRALSEYEIGGIKTTVSFHLQALSDARFVSGNYTTRFIEQMTPGDKQDAPDPRIAAAFATLVKHRTRKTARPAGSSGPSGTEFSAWKLAGRRAGLRK